MGHDPAEVGRGSRAAAVFALVLAACGSFGYQVDTISGLERDVFIAVNRHRVDEGLRPLSYSAEIATIARDHSQAMASGERPFGHEGLEARTAVIDRVLNLSRVAENVSRHSRGTVKVAQAAVRSWLASDRHRRNIEGYHQVTGVGVARAADGTTYLTQIFVTR